MDRKISQIALAGMALASFNLVSCSLLGGGQDKAASNDGYGLGAYQRAGGRIGGFGSGATATTRTADGSGGATAEGGSRTAAGITRDEDIVWAPEDPNKPIGSGLEELWKKPENKSWHISYKEAASQSRQTGKPMLIWFTDSMHSPLCRRLSEELFSTSSFEGWATQKLVRLRIDSNLPSKDRHTDLGVRKANYIKKLKKRYSVHGHPTVVLLMPSGQVHTRYRGYKKGDFDYYWARLKQDVVRVEDGYGRWREKYERRGYRIWTSRDGRKTFSKLHRYYQGRVTLIDPDGRRGTTTLKRLSDADQAWILDEKKKRDAARNR